MSRIGFLKFDISDIATVNRGTLRLYVEFSDQLDIRTLAFYDMTEIDWSEEELTWATAHLEGHH